MSNVADEIIPKTMVIQARHAASWDGLVHCRQLLPTIHHRQRTKRTLIRSRKFSWAWLIRGPHPDTNKRGTGLVGGLHIGRHVGWGRHLAWGWRTGWSDGWWTPSTSNQKSQLLKHQKWTKRHVSKRSIHNNTEMFSLHGGRVVGALVDARGAEKQKQAVRNRSMRVNFKEPYRHLSKTEIVQLRREGCEHVGCGWLSCVSRGRPPTASHVNHIIASV